MDEDKRSAGGAALFDEPRFSPRPNRAGEIAWRPWGEEAFRAAEREGKPVLLSISAVWCHWCHVMDETSYSDDRVIELVNGKYIPVRVDSDRNPDINRRYNQGGWPTTAFLSPDGSLLAGATYLPPETMRKALERISDLYRKHRDGISPPAVKMPRSGAREVELSMDPVADTGELLLRAWDRDYGGLGDAPKFPHPEAMALALALHAEGGSGQYLDLAVTTLRAMIRGNLLDKVEGGFFRYSTTRDWSVPHYEKMLSDNAGLLSVLLKAYGATGDEIFRRTAGETASFISRTLSDGGGRFFGSQDADEEYYLLDEAGRKGLAPPPVDRTVYTDVAARAAAAFLQAGAALDRAELKRQALEALAFLWEECFREGEGMAHYHDGAPRRWGLLDDNVSMAMALAQAYGHTGDGVYLERADKLLRQAVSDYWDDDGGVLLDVAARFSLPGLRPAPAELALQARAAEAMLASWLLGGEGRWRERARRVLEGASVQWASYGVLAAPYAAAVSLFLRGPLSVKVAGAEGGKPASFRRIAALSPRLGIIPMVSREMGRINGDDAEVCGPEACHLHTAEPAELAAYLKVDESLLKGVE